jgi:hypothetical protein
MTTISRKAAEYWWNILRPENDKVKIPSGISYYYYDYSLPWIPVTWEEVFKKRKEKQYSRLYTIRNSPSGNVTKPCFLWIFHNDSWIFSGWWIYVKLLKKDIPLNFRHCEQYEKLVNKIMELYPCGVFPVKENTKQWTEAFSKQYRHTGFGRKKNQGLLQCHCVLDKWGSVIDVF